jgi:KUP system potassium uptake protein
MSNIVNEPALPIGGAANSSGSETGGRTPHASSSSGFWGLALGSVGVVYGDIGTSPLYALKESLSAASAGEPPTPDIVIGVVSLILWTLLIIVTIKYVVIVLRADNNGEGGTLTLMALAQRAMGHGLAFIPVLGIIGAALFYGDAMITPAISVLSAVEGLSLVTPAFDPYVLPLSLGILVALFAVQSFGTASVAKWFGPITAFWFLTLAIGGLAHIGERPDILKALSPLPGVAFLIHHGSTGFVTLGAVFLAVTGAEALYADLGHFGRGPIRMAWLGLVFPALAINYMGQGSLVLAHPEAVENPFFRLYPAWALLPMVGLAALATIIASQAVITGAFSMTQQAVQLKLLPRFDVRNTSENEKGQIYIPRINWTLLIAVLFLVQAFRSSSALAAAYGIAVTGTMVITAIMAFLVAWRCWHWPVWGAAALMAPFLVIDCIFLAANATKLLEGGWLPLLVGGCITAIMLTWRRGSRLLADRTRRTEVPLDTFVASLEKRSPERVRGTAVFLTGMPDSVPTALLHNLKHNKILHERNVILSIETLDTPRVRDEDRIVMRSISDTFMTVALRFGYMEEPNVPRALALCRRLGVKFDVMQTSFFLSRRVLKRSSASSMPAWQDKLFIWLARRASDASAYFRIPTERAVEVGTQISI